MSALIGLFITLMAVLSYFDNDDDWPSGHA